MKIDIEIKKLKCERCGHSWVPRKQNIVICPSCKSPYWFRKKKEVENNETTNIRQKRTYT